MVLGVDLLADHLVVGRLDARKAHQRGDLSQPLHPHHLGQPAPGPARRRHRPQAKVGILRGPLGVGEQRPLGGQQVIGLVGKLYLAASGSVRSGRRYNPAPGL